MERRTITVYKISDISKHYPIAGPIGLADMMMEAYNTIFPRDAVQQPVLVGLSLEQLSRIQELVDCGLNLIQDTQILLNQPKPLLSTLVVTDLPQMLRLVITSTLSDHDASVAGKYNRRVAGTKRMRNTKTNNTRNKAIAVRQNVICAAPPQSILTQRRRWFLRKYKAYPEQLYAAAVFYVLDYMMTRDLKDEELGMCLHTVKNLVDLATKNSSQKHAAEASVKSRN